jgi:predicted NBD/HSP70 family sugar kinase
VKRDRRAPGFEAACPLLRIDSTGDNLRAAQRSVTFVGIDLGGTKVAAASLLDGELGPAAIEFSDRSGQTGLLDQLAALVDRIEARPA